MSSPTWQDGDDHIDLSAIGWGGWLRAGLRALALIALVFGGLLILLALRLLERPVFGQSRPVTPHITRFVCRNALRIVGMGMSVKGRPMQHPGAFVANHCSWLDIFSFNASAVLYFVSKSEVAGWFGIGWLARATGTVFITRDPKQARLQKDLFEARLGAGHRLLFFPEGTSTDGQRVLEFKPTLFAAFFSDALVEQLWVQPVTANYYAAEGEDARFYGWWGGMSFERHLIKTLAARRQGRVELIFHAPLKVSDYADRKALARAAQQAVASAHHVVGHSLG